MSNQPKSGDPVVLFYNGPRMTPSVADGVVESINDNGVAVVSARINGADRVFDCVHAESPDLISSSGVRSRCGWMVPAAEPAEPTQKPAEKPPTSPGSSSSGKSKSSGGAR